MTFRAPTRDDVDAIVAIAVACDIADFGAPDYDRDALLDEWGEPGVDLARDAFYDGRAAYGLVLGTDARAWVHPAHRGQGLGSALAARLEARARELELPFLAQQIGSVDADGRAMLEARGYRLAHAFAALSLPDDAVGALPTGGVRPYEPRDEAAVQALIEAAFAGGAGRVEPLEVVRARNPDTSLWFVAEDATGALTGAIRSELRAAGLLAGQLTQIAVAPDARGRGVGGQLIGAAARALVDAGAMTIRLHVRSSNPGALRLYERLGFSGRWLVDELHLAL